MNIKKSFEKRIRGWFPNEPYSISTGAEEDCKTNQLLSIPPEYDLSTKLVAGLTAVFWAILGSLLIVSFFCIVKNNGVIFQVAWVIVGVTIGAISGLVETKKQLKRLSKDHLLNTNKDDLIILVIPLFLLFITGEFISIYYSGLRTSALIGDLTAVFTFSVVVQVIRCGLFSAYEKKAHVYLMQSSFRGKIIAVQKASARNENQVNYSNGR